MATFLIYINYFLNGLNIPSQITRHLVDMYHRGIEIVKLLCNISQKAFYLLNS